MTMGKNHVGEVQKLPTLLSPCPGACSWGGTRQLERFRGRSHPQSSILPSGRWGEFEILAVECQLVFPGGGSGGGRSVVGVTGLEATPTLDPQSGKGQLSLQDR